MLIQTTKFPGCILILKTINISQPCLLTQHWEFIATSCYNQQKLCTVRHCTIPWTRHCWLKSKQKHFCLPQNTPKRCILHSNTHLDPLIKCPKQKITQPLHLHINSQHFQALGPVVFSLSLRTAKNLFTSIRNVSKTLPSIYYAPDQKKRHTLANCRVWFFLLHCQKS